MSYEIDSIFRWTCPCGNGYVEEVNKSNDWFQYKSYTNIVCPYCKENYRLTTSKNGKLSCVSKDIGEFKAIYIPYPQNYEEWLIANNSKESLRSLITEIVKYTAASKIPKNNYRLSEAIKESKHYNKTVALKKIYSNFEKALKNYDLYEYTPEVIQKIKETNKKHEEEIRKLELENAIELKEIPYNPEWEKRT